MSNNKLCKIDDILSEFAKITKDADQYLSSQTQYFDNFKEITKALYDIGKCSEQSTQKIIKSALQRLIIKDFDDEQIWQQIELQNKPFLTNISKNISKLLKSKTDIKLKKISSPISKKIKLLRNVSDNTETNKNVKKNDIKKVRFAPVSSSSSVVDDKFFKLAELEKFLDSEDMKESKKQNGNESSDEELIDYFKDDHSNSDDEMSARNATYKDFFDSPHDDDDDDDQEEKNKSSEFQINQDDDEEDDDKSSDFSEEESENEQLEDDEMYDTRDVEDDEMENLKGNKVKNVILHNDSDSDEDKGNELQLSDKSTYQKEQEKLKRKMQQLEKEILSEKPWQLKGEITSNVRPENSLIEEDLLYDHLIRQAPAITEETTMKLEDIIKQRIKDMAWDDVEKKQKPIEKPFEYKNAVLMEKDKKSLTEVYEQEYIKKQQICENEEGKELEEHKQIKNIMQSLFTKLDALSHFQFHPKPPVPDIKIISNIPAINVEEAIPEGISDAALLAPEEIKKKMKGVSKGKTEKDATDKKRERRKKKLQQKFRSKQKQIQKEKQLIKNIKPGLGNKYSKKEALKKIRNQGKSAFEDSVNEKVLYSSKAFFAKLQDKQAKKCKI